MQTAFNLQHELEDLRDFVVNEGICPLCKTKGELRRDNEKGEITCLNCGFTQTVYSPEMRCSGVGNNKDRQDAPVNELCYGRNLGSLVPDRALYKILGKSGTKNLGIRKIQVRNEIMKSQEKPITQRIKTYLSGWCKQFGWGNHVLLSNSLGNNARCVGTILTMMHNGKDSKHLAKAIFLLNVSKFFGSEKALEVATELQVKTLYVQKARSLVQLTKLIQ